MEKRGFIIYGREYWLTKAQLQKEVGVPDEDLEKLWKAGRRRPHFWGEKAPACMYCGGETEFESTGKNLSGQICDHYRCKKCFRITSRCG